MNKEIHYNKPQLASLLVGASVEYDVFGRGTGKTTVVAATKTAQSYFKTMPRSTGVIVNATFTQAYSRTLSELIKGWQALGYVMDHHFIVGQRPSEQWKKKWKWQGPYAAALDFKYVISWYNGAIAKIVSQERPGSSNGINIDWIFGDEAKLLDETKLKTELFPANRGIIPAFDGNPHHHGMLFTTDMPVGTAGRWILEKQKDMDVNVVNSILDLQTVRYILKHKELPGARKPIAAEIEKQIKVIDAEINELRHGLLFYQEASALANIHALGVDYIKQQLRDTTRFQFDTQILNIRPKKLEDGFYADLNEEVHGYFAENESYFDNREIDPLNAGLDCRKDKDLDWELPLHIALDYNRRIHPLVVGQDDKDGFIRTKNAMHALYPGKLKEVIKLFTDYYKTFKRRLVYYWYDHTAVGDDNETRKCDEVVGQLEKAGWTVIRMYMGKAPAHEAKYRMWGHLLTNDGHYPKRFAMNRENCRYLILSMYQSQAELKKDGFGKNKKSEHDPNFPAEESTHYGDAEDQLYYGMLESGLSYSNEVKTSVGIITGR